MLREETIKDLKEKIKLLNRQKSLNERLNSMIKLGDEVRRNVNDELDEIFSLVDLKPKKLNLLDEEEN